MTQWPQDTQLDSPIGFPPSHSTRGCRIIPIDRKCLVHLDVLAGLDAPRAQQALTRIVSVERLGFVDFIGLRLERDFLVFDLKQLGRIVNGAVTVVVVAYRAVQHVIGQQAIERFTLRGVSLWRIRSHAHALLDVHGASTGELSLHFDHAGVARLERAKLRMVTDGRQLHASSLNHVDQTLVSLSFVA